MCTSNDNDDDDMVGPRTPEVVAAAEFPPPESRLVTEDVAELLFETEVAVDVARLEAS